jgi:hypothetical protein
MAAAGSSARVAVAPNKFARGTDGSGRDVPRAYEVRELCEALTREYRTDAHLVTYLVPGAARQARVNKPGLAGLPEMPVVEAFFCDVDNPQHAEWTAESTEQAIAQESELSVLATAGVYFTAHGRRIVQPLAEAIPVDCVEPYLQRWLLGLEAAGLAVDWQCRDWTRHFRLPNVRRGGRDYRSPRIALERMRPLVLEPIDASAVALASASASAAATTAATATANDTTTPEGSLSATRAVRPLDWTRDLPAPWVPKVELIAAAVRAVSGPWHPLFLALAGALLAKRVPPEHVPMLCRAISVATGADTKTADRERAARDTVVARLAGRKATGLTSLAREWPAVADAVDEALATIGEARARALSAPPSEPIPPLGESLASLEQSLRDAPTGVTLISAECGMGKTQAAIRVAIDRAARGLRTSISVDKNELAIQVTRYLREAGAEVRRVFGPLSLLREDGTPECRYHSAAAPLVAGGQPVRLAFCQRDDGRDCEYAAQCRAKDGADGPEDARIVVGTHALIGTLAAAAGADGLLVIDEPPSVLETTEIDEHALRTTVWRLPYFGGRYAAAMRPALHAVGGWLMEATPRQGRRPMAFGNVVAEGVRNVTKADLGHACARTGAEPSGDAVCDVIACARGAFAPSHRGEVPPIQAAHLYACRVAVGFAREMGVASGVLGCLHQALASEGVVMARIEARGGARSLVVTQASEDFGEVVQREGPTILMDANADLHAPVVEQLTGKPARLLRFRALDGAPIARTMIRSRSSTRRRWFAGGRLVLSGGVVAAVGGAIRWAKEDPDARVLGVITFRALRVALALVRNPTDAKLADAWRAIAPEDEALADLHAKLGPLLGAWTGDVLFGHYGAVRGLDTMKDVDCLATIGDPWPNLGQVQHECDYLRLSVDWEARAEAVCRAELEQAHGRLRAVHRRRAGRALHIGRIPPGGSGWTAGHVQFRALTATSVPTQPSMSPDELRVLVEARGGVRALARDVGCCHSHISRCLQGLRTIDADFADLLRERAALATGVVPGPSS